MSLTLYSRENGRYPPLTSTEKNDLATRTKSGDESARERLVISNVGLVIHIAAAYARVIGRDMLDDLVEEGMIGLLKAIKKYKPDSGRSFTSYVSMYIRAAIIDRFYSRRETNGKQVRSQRNGSFPTISIDEFVSEEDDRTYEYFVADTQSPEPNHYLRLAEMSEGIATALEDLTEGEKIVITLRYGHSEMTRRAIGELLGVTESAIDKRERRALKKLRGNVSIGQLRQLLD